MQTTHVGVREDATVNLQEDSEVKYIAETFGVTPERVREVARKVGANYKAIQEELCRTDAHHSD
jgi:hypothetical protein